MKQKGYHSHFEIYKMHTGPKTVCFSDFENEEIKYFIPKNLVNFAGKVGQNFSKVEISYTDNFQISKLENGNGTKIDFSEIMSKIS